MRAFFSPPIFTDTERTQTARQLFFILWTIILALTPAMSILAVIESQVVLRWLLLIIVIDSVCLILLGLTRNGRTRLASLLLVVVLGSVVPVYAWNTGGVHAPIVQTYIILVFISGLLLGSRAGMLTAILSSLSGLGLVLAGAAGWLAPVAIQHSEFSLWVIFSLLLVVASGMQYLAASSVKRTMQKLQLELLERQKAQALLHESEARFRFITDKSPDVIWTMSLMTGKFTYVSPSVERMRGFTPEEVLNQNMAESMTVDSFVRTAQLLQKRIEAVRAGDTSALVMTSQVDQPRKNGSIVPTEVVTRLVFDAQGQPVEIIGVSRDITESKQAEEELGRMALALDIAPNAIMVHDFEGRILYANQRTFDLHGYSREEFMGLNLRELDAPASAERIAERMQELTDRGEASFQADHLRKDGSILPMDVSIRRTNWGEVDAILSIASDITERQRSEMALVKSQVLTNAIMDSTSDLIWSVDALDFRILTFNTALSQHFLEDRGITLQVGMLSEDIYPTAEFVNDWKEYYQRAISAGPYTTEYQVFSKKKFLQLTFNLLKRDGRVFGISVFGKDISERKRAEQAVLESEDRFRAVVQTANDAIITIDARGAIVDWNMAAETIFGFSAVEALGMPVERIVPGQFHGSHLQAVQNAFASQERQVVGKTAEVRGQTKAGREFPVEMSLARWKTQAGDFFTAVIRDISERKAAEERIGSSERKFRELFHVNKDGISIFLLGPDGKPGNFVECNTAAHQMLGYTRQELLGLTPLTLEPHTPPEVMQSRQVEFSSMGMINFETVIQHKDGHPVFTEFTAQVITYEDQPAIMNIVRDVSERKLAEDALRQSEEKYRTVADFTYAWETWRAPNGECLYVSPSCERISGHSPAEFRSDENLTVRITHPDDQSRVLAHFRENREQDSEQDQELVFRIILPDGEIRWLSHNCTAVYAADGHWLGRRESNRDITDRKQRENELEAISILSTALRTAPNRDEMLPVIVRELGSLMHCDVIAVVMVDPLTDENVVEAASGVWTEMKGARQPAADGLNGVVRETRKAYHNNQIGTDTRIGIPPRLMLGLSAGAGVPMIAQDKLVGILWIGRKTEIHDSEVRLLTAIGDMAANAIQRATLHEQTKKDAADLILAYDTTLEGWAHALEMRDQETEGHTRRVVQMTVDLASKMGIGKPELENVRRGALLHDIGKMGIPDSVLLKPGKLNECELEIMHRHPEYAYQFLEGIEFLRPVLDIPFCHHEKWDGSGYPRGLKGEQIPLVARIFAIVDVWDALRSDRPYRTAWSNENTLKYITEQCGLHFDPLVVQEFLEIQSNG